VITPDATTPTNRLRVARTWAGVRQATFSRQTGVLVLVLNAGEAGIVYDPAEPWLLVCEDHGTTEPRATVLGARADAATPADWCLECFHELLANPGP
jgi:hypothetical protein